jgi:hypothetical protein
MSLCCAKMCNACVLSFVSPELVKWEQFVAGLTKAHSTFLLRQNQYICRCLVTVT